MDQLGDSTTKLPLRLVRQIDELCDEYELRLAEGESIDFTTILERAEPDVRRKLLGELVGLALDHLRGLGNTTPEETLLNHHANMRADVEAALAEHIAVQETTHFDGPEMAAQPANLTPQRRTSRMLRIRCPHCNEQVELVGDTPYDIVNCSVCGDTFNLVDRSTETQFAEVLQKIDRFELVSRLGMGGFGTVWKARDTELDRAVAVKIPRHGQLTAEEIEQFIQEARFVAQLRHPNIVPVHEIGREGDVVYIISDLIRGISLVQLLTRGAVAPRDAAALCATIGEALEHAHRRGVIHRDLKPSNIMIDDEKRPHLMDFGLAKREHDELTMTTDGQVIGTPAYMSPEQAAGRSPWVDRRTDIYSLGVVLFELLTGELPFRGNAQMQAYQRINEDAPSIRSLNRHLPKDLATICAKCLERELGNRYQTAKEVVDELYRYLENVPIKARPISMPERLVRWAVRRPFQAAVAALVLFLAIVGPIVAATIARQRLLLNEIVKEQANLIKEKQRENLDAIAKSSALEAELDVLKGKTSNWDLWPLDSAVPPKRLQLESLLTARSDALNKSSNDDFEEAQRLLALGTIYEASNHPADAEKSLDVASEVLERLRISRPDSISVAMALADCYYRLSLLSKEDRDKSSAWLEKALALRTSLAEKHPRDPLLQANRIDAEMRTGSEAGFDDPAKQLVQAGERHARLAGLWPNSAAAIYRIACLLAGRQPILADEPKTDAAATDSKP